MQSKYVFPQSHIGGHTPNLRVRMPQPYACPVPAHDDDRVRSRRADYDETWRDDVVALVPALRAFAWSLSHNSADADDLVQETLIKAWSNRDKFEPGTNLRAWLFTILRNTYYTSLAKKRREVADEDGKHAATLSAAPTQDWSVAMRSLQAALQRLPHEHREALVLVGAAGLTYEEAAEICGCALGTIKSRVNRARAKLMKIMDSEESGTSAWGPPVGH
jgi:RNA polymerase sigma-70 factor (ECF subfamily)